MADQLPIVETLRDATVDVLTREPLDPGAFVSLTVEDAAQAAEAIEALVAALGACACACKPEEERICVFTGCRFRNAGVVLEKVRAMR